MIMPNPSSKRKRRQVGNHKSAVLMFDLYRITRFHQKYINVLWCFTIILMTALQSKRIYKKNDTSEFLWFCCDITLDALHSH